MNHCKTIALVNQKGGVGKTTSTINLGFGLASQGNKVLLVDGDPQHSLTIGLGVTDPDNLEHTLNTAMLPKLGVSLPIYHGTEEETLDRGVGHLIGSSLPIGGSSTHAILTGHSGLASQKMFSDLDKLEIGDTFYLEVLNEILAYEVDQINTVLPHDTTYLGLEEGKDLCTLVTCTPFGVNTYRLLIRGHRIAYTPEDEESPTTEPAETSEPVDSTWEQEYEKGVYFAIGVVVIICLVLFLGWLMQRGESRAS